jgi:RNA-directed DNA polymerase
MATEQLQLRTDESVFRQRGDELGSPQGSIVSPVIANVFLDKVLDQWVATTVKAHCRGYCELIRDADDTLLVFEREDDAQWILRVLPLRLVTFGKRAA